MSSWRPTMDKEKYKQAILFFLNSSANNIRLGKVKLFKLLYYADFDHYQVYKTPITGDVYNKKAYGPVPQSAQAIMYEMCSDNLLEMTTRRIGDYRQNVYTPLVSHQPDAFTTTEMQVLDHVVQKWTSHSTQEIVVATHGEAPWRAVEMAEEIPYALAFYRRQIEEHDHDEELEEVTASR